MALSRLSLLVRLKKLHTMQPPDSLQIQVGQVRLLRLKPGGTERDAGRAQGQRCGSTIDTLQRVQCSLWIANLLRLQHPQLSASQNLELRSPAAQSTCTHTAAAQWRLVGDREDQGIFSCLTLGGRMGGLDSNYCTNITVAVAKTLLGFPAPP